MTVWIDNAHIWMFGAPMPVSGGVASAEDQFVIYSFFLVKAVKQKKFRIYCMFSKCSGLYIFFVTYRGYTLRACVMLYI